MTKQQKRGAKAFHQFYQDHYQERWDELEKSLLEPTKHVAWWNGEVHDELPENAHRIENFSSLIKFDHFKTNSNFYFLDFASACAVEALQVSSADCVLDMCAAPGGKSLGISLALGDGGKLLANDKSDSRRNRLKHVLENFLSPAQRQRVEVQGYDASLFGLKRAQEFDRVLLDAPCSSERHLLQNSSLLSDWSLGRTKRLSKLQGTLLASGFDALKPGGKMVYSTCSISPFENDGLGEWLERKRPGLFDLEFSEWPHGEKTEYGHIFLPDRASGYGPLFFMCIRKKG